MRLSSLYYEAGGSRPGGEGKERTSRPWHSELLAAHCGALLEASRDLPTRAPASAWAVVFTAWLKAAGWGAPRRGEAGGGSRPLDSHEFQAVEAWNTLLSRFSSLADFAGSLSAAEALVLLGRLAAETLFQPRGADAPVQVLGLYEAIGQSFDYLWVMGLHDAAWPPAAAPDPFIPLGLPMSLRLRSYEKSIFSLTAEDNKVRYYVSGSLHGSGDYVVKAIPTPPD